MSPILHRQRPRITAFAAALAAIFILSIYPMAQGAAAKPPITAPAAAAKDQLPDLAMLPLSQFYLDYDHGRRIVRFSTLVENLGDGPFEVVGSRPNKKTRDLKVVQNIHETDGRIRHIATRAIMRFSFLDMHDHFHVQNFEEYKLRPEGSTTWRRGHKEGFCVFEDGRAYRERPPQYDNCGQGEPDLLTVKEGLAVGWVDDYEWYLPGQSIYIDGLHLPGNFCVSASVDPLRLFTEKTRSNDATSTLVRITSQKVDVIRQGC